MQHTYNLDEYKDSIDGTRIAFKICDYDGETDSNEKRGSVSSYPIEVKINDGSEIGLGWQAEIRFMLDSVPTTCRTDLRMPNDREEVIGWVQAMLYRLFNYEISLS